MKITVTYNHKPSEKAMKNFMRLINEFYIKHNAETIEEKPSTVKGVRTD